MRKFLILYFLFSFFFFSLLASGTMDSQDGFQYLAVARNLYYRHEPTAPPYEYPQANIHMNISQGKNGKWYSPTGLGYSLAMLPAVALSDLFHRQYNAPPPEHFPLQSDFSLLLFASFTNVFFSALLVVILYAYLRDLDSTHRNSWLWSFLAVAATNLIAYAKHSFAHMMYLSFLTWSFFLIHRFSRTKQRRYLALAGFIFGIVVIAYNPVFVLPIPALGLYYLLTTKFKFTAKVILSTLGDIAAGVGGAIPFILLYLWYNSIRLGNPINSGYGIPPVASFFGSIKVLFEGAWGFLFSPGRSFFLYSPILLLPVVFWHKIPYKKYFPEICSFLVLAAVFVYFYGIQEPGPNWYGWSGESSWGPRYITPLIPFLGIITALLYPLLSRFQKRAIFLPLLALSIWIQALGVLLPYQIKFGTLPTKLYINQLEYQQADFGNFIPRFSPLISMSRHLVRRLREFPKAIERGPYEVRFLEGFEFPFFLGNRIPWRGVGKTAYLQFKNTSAQPVRTLDFEFSNTRLDSESSYPIQVSVVLNNSVLGSTTIDSEKWGQILAEFPSDSETGVYTLRLEREFVGTNSAQQVLFLKDLVINQTPVNLASLDLMLYEPLASNMSGVQYRLPNQGKENRWFSWYQNSAVYEGSFDLWWVRALYYFDYPKPLLVILITLVAGNLFTGIALMLRERGTPLDRKQRQPATNERRQR